MNINAPAKYPNNAINETSFKYHPKLTFSSPITTTPAADPTIKMLPPTPAQYARNNQNAPSTAK